MKVALVTFSILNFNTVDRRIGISLEHVLMKTVLNQNVGDLRLVGLFC